MRDLEALRTLERLPLDELIEGQRRPGRAEMDPAFLAHWTEQYHRAVELATDPRSSRATRSLAQLLKDLTFPLIAQQEDPIPEYYPYTGVHHLEWYLENRHQSWDRLKARAAEGIFHTLVDFIRFESQSLAGLEPWHRENFHREDVTQRIHVLERAVEKCHELGRLIPEASMDRNRTARRYDALGEYAAEPSRVSAMVEFSMMPQTRFHDEVLFLRIIHISEFCFFGIRVAVREARELLVNGLVHGVDGWVDDDRQWLPYGFDQLLPGPFLALIVSSLDPKRLNGHDKVRFMKARARLSSHHEAGKYEAMGEVAYAPPSDPERSSGRPRCHLSAIKVGAHALLAW